MGVARERGCRQSPSPRGNARTEMRLESAERHRADPTVPSRESGSKRHRPPIAATDQSASRRYGRKPGIAVFIGRHIFNRSFRNDVNAGVSETVGMGISVSLFFFDPPNRFVQIPRDLSILLALLFSLFWGPPMCLASLLCADIVAKVFLHSRSKFLLAVHANFV
jgi:hypothetical protein